MATTKMTYGGCIATLTIFVILGFAYGVGVAAAQRLLG